MLQSSAKQGIRCHDHLSQGLLLSQQMALIFAAFIHKSTIYVIFALP